MRDLSVKFEVFKNDPTNSPMNSLRYNLRKSLNYRTLTYMTYRLSIYIEQSIQKRVLVVKNEQNSE